MVEFAIVAPVMIVMLIGIFDIANLLIVQRRVSLAAAEAVEIATNLAIQPNSTNVLTYNNVYAAGTAIFAYFPAWETNPNQTFSVTLSALSMTGQPAGCSGTACTSYVANVAWSLAGSQNEPYATWRGFYWDTAQERPCQPPLTSSTPSSVPDLPYSSTPASQLSNYKQIYSVPAGVLSSSALIVADVSAVFVPMFLNFITGPVLVTRSYFVPPRTGNNTLYVQYTKDSNTATSQMTAANALPVQLCPGYY